MVASRAARAFLLVFVAALAFPQTQRRPDPPAFRFLVFGDSRLPGYFPYRDDDSVRRFFRTVIDYAYGPEVSFDLTTEYDGSTGALASATVIPNGQQEKRVKYILRDGWPEMIVVGAAELPTLHAEGQRWVFDSVVSAMHEPDPPAFVIHTGDITYTAEEGRTAGREYWEQFDGKFLRRLPRGAQPGLVARFFPAPGNHESWGDEQLAGMRGNFPYLQRLGFTADRRIYKFDYRGARFIFLDTGDMDYRDPSAWESIHPFFLGQMSTVQQWLREAKARHLRNVFITFHNPTFCLAPPGPIPDRQNPHPYLRPFAKELNITVLNGHVHTTELYEVDGIHYLVLGGGGGEQTLNAPVPPPNYPEELYWRGQPRVEEYNYLEVTVGAEVTFTLHRYRPGAAEEKTEVRVFAGD